MQTPAQYMTLIQIQEDLIKNPSPADRLLSKTFKNNRYMGGKDKKFITNTLYALLRMRNTLDFYLNAASLTPNGRTRTLAYTLHIQEDPTTIFTGEQYQPDELSDAEQAFVDRFEDIKQKSLPEAAKLNMPEWLLPTLKKQFGDALPTLAESLNTQAPTDVRANTLKTTREKLQTAFENEGYTSRPTPISPTGLRLTDRAPLTTLPEFRQGHFEIQDEGSQLLAQLTAPEGNQYIIDFCAGAGGKTLALAALMGNKGRILACDIHTFKLEEARRRAKRAGLNNVKTHTLLPTGDKFLKRQNNKADIVLVDAPCTGTGTWRRNPDAKWRLTETDIQEITMLQKNILERAARLVKPGGKLVYATCSLLEAENQAQADAFQKAHPHFTPQPFTEPFLQKEVTSLQLTPHQHEMDGFFIAMWEREIEDQPKKDA